jgi:hypothetical protein
MTIDDVAKLLGIRRHTARQRAYRGSLPVKPRPRAYPKAPYEWSSLDWFKWFNGTKK